MLLNKIHKRITLDADTKFITIAFIKIFVAKTLILWIAVLLAGEGRGTYIQFPIFYSWLALPAFLELSHESTAWMVYSYSVPIAFFVVSSVLALTLWFKAAGKKFLRNVLVVHFAGAIACIVIAEYYGAPLSTSLTIKAVGALTSLAVSYFFWRMFFKIVDYKLR
jgi:hypothetical protein